MLHKIIKPSLVLLSFTTSVCVSIVSSHVEFRNYQIAHFVSITITIHIAAYMCSKYTMCLLMKRIGFMFMYTGQMQRSICGVLLVIFSSMYQHLVFNHIMCDLVDNEDDPLTCSIISKVFSVGLLILCVFNLINVIRISLFAYTFVYRRKSAWNELQNIEHILCFNDNVKKICSSIGDEPMVSDLALKDFVGYWTRLSDVEILESLESKAAHVYNVLKINMDTTCDALISKDEFTTYMNTVPNAYDVQGIWNILSDGEHISQSKLEDVLYKLFYKRRMFAFMIYTDHLVIGLLIRYIAFVSYTLSLVFVTRILEYEAFGEGVDLFKLYLILVSYLASLVKEKIHFILTMIIHRPYNIGDILLVDDKIYTCDSFCDTNTLLIGPTSLLIRNTLIDDRVFNLTKEYVRDSISFCLPHSMYNQDRTTIIKKHLDDYAHSNCRFIDPSSIRCGWIGTNENGYRIVQCNWKYNFKICDAKSYITHRAHIIDFIVASLEPQLSKDWISYQLASGGVQLE